MGMGRNVGDGGAHRGVALSVAADKGQISAECRQCGGVAAFPEIDGWVAAKCFCYKREPESWSEPLKVRLPIIPLCLIVGVASAGQPAPQPIPDDLSLLVGKQVVVGRLGLCEPKSFGMKLEYAGKKATVVSFEANATFPKLSPDVMSRMPPASRTLVEDAMRGGTMTFEFRDGKRLDTCGLAGLSALKQNLELVPGQTIALPSVSEKQSQPPAQIAGTAGPQECPVQVSDLSSGVSFGHALLEALTMSQFQRQLDETVHGSRHYLDMEVRNESDRPVAAVEMVATYANNMGDEVGSATYISQNEDPINPGDEYKANAMDRSQWSASGVGKVTLHIQRVRFADNTFWQDNGTRSCSRSIASSR